ncbi:DedA family protein [Ramlibacter sp. PS3R-8]|uniref:DedA family protein n=1 Tax=Ramlibacter sp. PS3R-8 TaxID=3133437 RepID=UPI0030B54BE8
MFFDIFLGLLASLQGAAAYGMALWLLFSAGVGAPLSQDVLLLASAKLASMQPIPLVLVAWLAVMAGDTLSLWIGHHYGARWIRKPWARRIVAPERLPGLEEKMRRYGGLLAFVTRFLPGQRGTLFFIYGTLRLPYRTFFLANGIAAAIQVPLFVYGARSLGWQWQALQTRFDGADTILTVAVVAILLAWWLRERRRTRTA